MIRTLFAILPAGSRKRVIAHTALTVLGVLLRAAGAVLLIPLVTALFSMTPADAWPWLGALAVVTLAGWFIDASAARIGFDLGFGLLETGQRRVADQLTRVRLPWFNTAHTATAREAIAATGPDLVGLIIYLVTPMLSAVLLPIFIALALLPICWPLAVAALVSVPLLAGAFWLSGALSRRADAVAAAANQRLGERVIEFARTQKALRASRRIAPEQSQVGEALAAQHGASLRLILLQLPGQLLFGIASQLALIALVGTIIALTLRGDLGAAQAVACIVVAVRILESFTMLAELSPGVAAATGALRRMQQVLTAPQVRAGNDQVALSEAPEIALRGVSFGYAEDAPVLDDLDLVLQPGTTTAIVGPSGSGKSTVLALLAGLVEPQRGQVLVNGQDAPVLDSASRRAITSVVFQQPYLFDTSIRENVLVGQPDADASAIARATSLAQVDGLVSRLPDGWQSRVGDAGTTLSGGERQRVSIARALLKPAPVLLVDEATSALDTENEAAIVAALGDQRGARTQVIVAHRLSSIRAADRVVFLERGRIIEDGTIEELLARGDRFATFWQHQHSAREWGLGREG